MTEAHTTVSPAKNEIALLREQLAALGAGCDANGGGLHSRMASKDGDFCPDCGLMLKRIAYVLPHIKPSETRAAMSAVDRLREALDKARDCLTGRWQSPTIRNKVVGIIDAALSSPEPMGEEDS